jgi:hypothetical protein
MNTPLQAKPVAWPRGRRVTGQGEERRTTAPQPEADARAEPPRGERLYLPQAGLIRVSSREVQEFEGRSPCARDAQGGRRPSPKGMNAKA